MNEEPVPVVEGPAKRVSRKPGGDMHWSRWGDPRQSTDLPQPAKELVEAAFGARDPDPGVALDDVRLPEPGLADELLDELSELVGAAHVHTDHGTRVGRTRGKSTPDLLRMRAGDGSDAPDVVVRPADHDEVAGMVSWCSRRSVALVPFGGGTSVVGGLVARRDGYAGVVALDLGRLDRLLEVDLISGIATLEAGVRGPEAEALLAEHGLTLGHFPQSFEYASIGGFAATRSSGQSSSGYGRFDDLVTGLQVATPLGDLDLGRAPASAAGPDLRQLVLGSEGALGVITAVTVRVRPQPLTARYLGWSFDTFSDGADAIRDLAQAGLAPTVLRLSDETETAVNLAQGAAEPSSDATGAVMITGFEGEQAPVDRRLELVRARLTELGGREIGEDFGAAWAEGRFRAPYLRDALLDVGVLVETLETATFWSRLPMLYDDVRAALESTLTVEDATPLVLCHISHVYETGASLYFTVAVKQLDDPLEQWSRAKDAAGAAIIAAGATITHHHGVGRDHQPWLGDEIGPVGMEMLRAVKQRIDPAGVLNPGVLIP